MSKIRNDKTVKNREKVFKAIIQEDNQDLVTLQIRLKKLIGLSGHKFDDAIESLKNEGRIVVTGKKVSASPSSVKTGTYFLSGNKSYVVFDGDNRQYGIDRTHTGNAHSGDKVRVGFSYTPGVKQPLPFIISSSKPVYTTNPETDSEGLSLQSTINPNLVYGRVMKTDHDNLVFIPNDKKRFKENILILNEKKTWGSFQDKICVLELATPHKTDMSPMGFIVQVKGDAGNPIQEYDSIAESHGAIMSWENNPKLKAEIERIPEFVDTKLYNFVDENGNMLVNNGSETNIVNLKHIGFTTTDPATCKDMDDAIYSTYDENGNLVVYTAVADVPRYVAKDSEIYKNYIRGVFTTYAPNKAYNILPPQLSTNICSLNPGVDRLAFVAKLTIDPKTGKTIDAKFMEALIESKEKYSYEQAQEISDNNTHITQEHIVRKSRNRDELTAEEQVVANQITSNIIQNGFKSRNQLQFNTNNEYDVIFNNDFSNILDIKQQQHIPYHKVIESFMVATNEATAKFAMENNIPIIYRVHDEPNEEKLDQAYEFFGYLDIPFEGDLSPQGTQNLIESVKGTFKEKVVNNFLVRMQSKAKYSVSTDPKEVEFVSDKVKQRTKGGKNAPKNKSTNSNKAELVKQLLEGINAENTDPISHFGLQSTGYSHTTSPIRRIPDYFTIHNIVAFQNGKDMIPIEYLREVAMWANQMQDENDLAEREFNELNSAIYAENNINKVMSGHIVSFKYITDGKHSGIGDLMVVVENEETGVRVHIPAIEVLGSKISTGNLELSQFGTAIINGDSNKALITVCDEVKFKIAEANRVTRMVYASTNLLKDFTVENFAEELANMQQSSIPVSRNTGYGRIVQNTEYKHKHQAQQDQNELLIENRSKKEIKQFKGSDIAEDITPFEATENHKRSTRKAKSCREAARYNEIISDYTLYDISESTYADNIEENDALKNLYDDDDTSSND